MGGAALLLRLVSASMRGQARYPLSAAMLTLGALMNTGIEVGAMWALFERFGSVRGWTLGEVALFYAMVNAMFAFADLLGRGFDVLGDELLRTGAFDRMLLRPRGIVLQLMGHDFRISRFGRLAQAIGVGVFASTAAGIAWSPARAALLVFAVAGGAALFLGILALEGALAFWTVQSLEVANVATYGSVQAGMYPLAIYARWFRRTLTFVLPLACVAYYPALRILGHDDPLGSPAWLGWLSPLAGFAFLAVALKVFGFGLRRHASTGS